MSGVGEAARLAAPGESGVWRYAALLPQLDAAHRLTLGEGNTPLVRSRAIARELGLHRLYFKLESANPTGSYKDRISAVGVSAALARGRAALIGTSSGNAGASVAAYAARAGLPYHLLVLEHVAEAKIGQALLHGARIRKIAGFGTSTEVGERVFRYIEAAAQRANWEVMITAFRYNALAMEGVKTIAFELYEQLGGRAPDAVFAPAGGGGLCAGVDRGFAELAARGL
ncbi:pyridoxal-phosphate dependent enzyme, partial [Paenibacillus sp. IB182496]